MSDGKNNLYRQFVHLEWLLRRYQIRKFRENGPFSDPHRGQGRVLALLKLKPVISQKDLSRILDIRSQSLGELLIKLERNGYVTRASSEKDRRIMEIRLTDAGKKAAEQSEPQPNEDQLFNCLSEEEQTNMSNYIARIISCLEKEYGDDNAESVDRERHGPHVHGRRGFDFRFRGAPFDFKGDIWCSGENSDE
ncbi:MAG: MarR family winged helix-turn-helix transcriptional regulator [Kiritimatiellales bacterium]